MGNAFASWRRATKNHQNWQQFATLVIFSPLFIHTARARARPGTPSSSSPDEVERPSAATWSVWCYSNFYDTKHVAVREQRCRERAPANNKGILSIFWLLESLRIGMLLVDVLNSIEVE